MSTSKPVRKNSLVLACVSAMVLTSLAIAVGCASTGERAQQEKLTANVGVYDPPPEGLAPVRAGVPRFKVTSETDYERRNLDVVASEKLTTLIQKTRRFSVIERSQLEQVLDEQALEGVVKADEVAQPGQVRGVDYLIYGTVTSLRMKKEKGEGGWTVPVPVVGRLGREKGKVMIRAECGVDLRVVDPTSGQVIVAESGAFERIDEAEALGLQIGGFKSSASAEVTITDDDRGQVLELALDDAVRKMLPEIDRKLMERGQAASSGATASEPVEPAESASEASFCSACGERLDEGAKFCSGCGAEVSR